MLKNKKTLITALILYALSTGASFATFNFLDSSPTSSVSPLATTPDGGLAIDPGAPRDQQCPLNGAMFTDIERKSWENRRPLVVMIENHQEARPQSGLSKADVVYEAVAEGGITRFAAVFLCAAQANDVTVAPVRSARTYYLDWASEYGETPLYAHVGGANTPNKADALGQIQKYGWGGRYGNDLNQFSLGFPTFWRDYNRLGHSVATEHTMVSTTEKLWEAGEERGWTNLDPDGEEWMDNFTEWKFQDESGSTDGESATSIKFDFWEDFAQYAVAYAYDSQTNTYKRSTGGVAHLDLNTDEQIGVSTVVVQFVAETGPIDELKHMLYGTIDDGKALIFQDGKVVEGTWSKATRIGRTIFEDSAGNEIEFVGGPIWIHAVPTGSQIDY